MKHLISISDKAFKEQVETFNYPIIDFNHRAHLRLAYIYLVENNTETAIQLMRYTLHQLLQHNDIDPNTKYHETLTTAWVLALNYLMNNAEPAEAAHEFLSKNPKILDSKIMMEHYSNDLLFSETARQLFVEPDLKPIPVCAI